MRPRTGQLTGTGTGTRNGLLVLLVAAPLALSACSGNTQGPTASSRAAGAAQAPAKADANGFAAPGSSGSADSAKTGGTAAVLAQTGRSLIITAGLQVKTGDATAAAARAQQVVQVAGGFVAGESIGSGSQSMPATASDGSSGGGSAPGSSGAAGGGTLPSPLILPGVTGASDSTQALLVLRVPPPRLDSVLGALTGKGDQVTYQSRTATDVTGQVADVASRVTSAQASIAELRTLINKAVSMNDLISLEQALAQRESDLESLQAQQKSLADQVQYATVTVGYYSQGAPAAAPPVRTGFMRGLTTGWHGFTRTVRALLVAIGWLVPYAVVIAVLWWPVRRLVRWNKGRGRSAPVAPVLATTGPATPETPSSPPSED